MHSTALSSPTATTPQQEQAFLSLMTGAALLSHTWRKPCLEFCRQNPTYVAAALPGCLAALAHAGQFSLMLDMVSRFGGRRIYLPTRCERFLALTGIDFPPRLYQRWRELADVNGQLDVPGSWGLLLAFRRAAIRLALDQGCRPADLNATHGVTKRQLKAQPLSGARETDGINCSAKPR